MEQPNDADLSTLRTEALARVGSRIDQWRIDELLGVGGMAAVFAATHASGRRAAFKILHRCFAVDEELVARFVDERSIAEKIAHPAAVRIEAVAQTDEGVPLLFMELLEGETLERALRRGMRLDGDHALAIADELLDFLVACHARGIVHRDLKPANVFLQRAGGVKVLDFGTAREQTRRRTNRRMAIGTPGYMPPEQARGEPLDGRADVFAVGGVLHALFSGALRTATTREPPPSLALLAPDLPPAIVDFVMKALAWDANDRWSSAAEMREVLRRLRGEHDLRSALAPANSARPQPALGDRATDPGTPSAIRRLRGEEETSLS